MPNWKKVIVSGSDASLNSLSVGETGVTGSLNVFKSGSTVFRVEGSQGTLFEITDNLSGSLFTVADISGVPILEVFSDDTVKLGTFGNEAIVVNGDTADISGSFQGTVKIDSIVNAGTDTDKFLVLDSSGNVDFRTGTEVRSDIGAGTGNGTMSSWTIKEGNGSESTTVTNGETLTIAQGTGIQSEMTSTSSGGTLTITNTAPDQTVSISDGGATTVSGTYPNFTISSTDTTYTTATVSTLGLVKLANGTTNTVSVNTPSTTVGRNYPVQLNSSDQMVVNVPWTDTKPTSVSIATATTEGVVKLEDNTVQTVAANSVTSTAFRTYGVQLNSSDQMVVNVPWTDTNTIYTHPTHPGDDFSVDTGALTGATVVSDIDINVTTDSLGHVTDANGSVSTRTLTLGDLGYTGAPDADNYGSWNITDGTTSTDIDSGGTVEFTAGSNISISNTAGVFTISSTDNNTTYSAGSGIGLSGTTFSVAAGTGLSQDAGGLSLATAGAGAGTYGSTADGTKIDTITIDAYGRVTSVATGTTGDILGVFAGTGLSGGGSSGTPTINVDYAGTDNVVLAAGAGTGTPDTGWKLLLSDDLNNADHYPLSDLPFSNNSGTVTSVATGTGLTGGTITSTGTLSLDYAGTSNFIDSATNLEGTPITTGDTIVYHDAGDNNVKKGFVSDLPFDNYVKWQISDGTTSNNVATGNTVTLSGGTDIDVTNDGSGNLTIDFTGTSGGGVQSVTGGTNISTSGTSTNVTVNLDAVVSNTSFRLPDAAVTKPTLSFGTDTSSGLYNNASTATLNFSIKGTYAGGFTSPGFRVQEGMAVGNISIAGTQGRIDASNDVVAFSSSDKRWKENIKPIENALDKLSKIGGYEFDWKELTEEERKTQHSNEGHDVGVIAQEVEEILPEVVTTRENGYKGVRYEKLVPLLIESIKELQSEINELKRSM
jgi:hypothetical protein